MIGELITLLFRLSAVLFFTALVAIGQLILLWKNKFSYFKSPKTVEYPKCVKDKKYGESKFINIQTTQGIEDEKLTLKIHYMINGDGNQPTMLFLHGFPEFWFSWRHQILEFSKTHRVLAMDLRGYGQSDKPSGVENFQMKHLVNDIKGFLDALGIHSVILLGHDFGGSISWNFEKTYPEMVEKLIALNSPESKAFQKFWKKNWAQYLKSWFVLFFQVPFFPEWVISRLDMERIELIMTSKSSGLQKKKLSQEEIDAYKANMAQSGALTAAINYYRAVFQNSRDKKEKCDDKRTEEYRYMLIFGNLDNYISINCAKETKIYVPNVDLRILPGLSHWVQQDDPVLVNRLIKEFIEHK